MTMKEPRWLQYAEFELINGFPMMTGFKKGTPKEIIEEYETESEAIRKAREEGIIL